MFLFVFWIANFRAFGKFFIQSKAFPDFKKVKNHCCKEFRDNLAPERPEARKFPTMMATLETSVSGKVQQ